jgi:Bacterial SH3 domain
MLRLTLLLCVAMIGALMLLGEDRGQMRPGLAKAAAEGRLPVADAEPAPVEIAAEAEPVEIAAQAEPVPEPVAVPVAEPVAEAVDAAIAEATAEASVEPDPYVEPVRDVVQAVEEPVFTLSALGNELVPGEAGSVVDTSAVDTPAIQPPGDGTIWYVNATSVNVRAAPTTEAEVLGKLANGEAALLVEDYDGEWARIVIQGDGVEGYVALRYLSPEAP